MNCPFPLQRPPVQDHSMPGNERGPEREAVRAQMQDVADRLICPIAVLSGDSTLLYLNPAAARALGHDATDLMGRRMLDFVHPDDRTRIRRQLLSIASHRTGGGRTRYRLRTAHTSEWRMVESTADNLIDDPNVGGILVSARDLTEEQTSIGASGEDRLAQLERHLRRIAAEVESSGALRRSNPPIDPARLARMEGLTDRQWEVLNRLARGERVPTIAAALYVSQSTVRNHLTAVFARFGVHSQVELLAVLRSDPNHMWAS
jgi:PAS domain S-box-containing protein